MKIYLKCLLFVSSCLLVNGNAFDDIMSCSTDLAEICFRGFMKNLASLGDNYKDDNITDICSATDDRIKCAKNVIDTDCNVKDGKANFDNWMDGLTAVYNYLCIESRGSLKDLSKTVDNQRCFDLDGYVQCVARKAKVTHIVDLLRVALDVNECNWILISFTTCGANSINHFKPSCSHWQTQDILNEVLHIFTQKTKCTALCSGASIINNSILILTFWITINILLNVK